MPLTCSEDVQLSAEDKGCACIHVLSLKRGRDVFALNGVYSWRDHVVFITVLAIGRQMCWGQGQPGGLTRAGVACRQGRETHRLDSGPRRHPRWRWNRKTGLPTRASGRESKRGHIRSDTSGGVRSCRGDLSIRFCGQPLFATCSYVLCVSLLSGCIRAGGGTETYIRL